MHIFNSEGGDGQIRKKGNWLLHLGLRRGYGYDCYGCHGTKLLSSNPLLRLDLQTVPPCILSKHRLVPRNLASMPVERKKISGHRAEEDSDLYYNILHKTIDLFWLIAQFHSYRKNPSLFQGRLWQIWLTCCKKAFFSCFPFLVLRIYRIR